MVTLSAGLSFSLGKVGYKRVVDANPYITQNEWLLDYANRLQMRNRMLSSQHNEDERIKAEYRKILEIEGLLDLYRDRIPEDNRTGARPLYPRNDYSGLNSLRARMNNRGWDGSLDKMPRAMQKRDEGNGEPAKGLDMTWDAYLTAMMNGEKPIGAPIYFFFQMGKDKLTDASQILNIDEIAEVVKVTTVKVKVIGAADAATGNEHINDNLSRLRADYIRRLLMERGIEGSRITTAYEGGINDYSPVQANRNTCVILSF
jgi:outer membrane protein OmpA-like peptidoglycan-associated protein